MKKFITPSLLLILLIFFGSCAKNNSPSTSTTLQVSATGTLQIGQPVTFTLPSASSGTVSWSVNPNLATISASGNTASIMFQTSGNYVVTGVSGSTTSSSNVTVDTSRYAAPGTNPVAAFAANEQLNITVKKADSGTVSGLYLQLQTAGSYNCQNNFLSYKWGYTASTISIDLAGVYTPASCSSGTLKAAATIGLPYPFPAGATQLSIKFNGTTYTGTITKTNNSYAINWAYTSGVVITPLSL